MRNQFIKIKLVKFTLVHLRTTALSVSMMTMNSSITLLLIIVMILSTHVHCFSRMQKSIKYPTITPSPGVTVFTGRVR